MKLPNVPVGVRQWAYGIAVAAAPILVIRGVLDAAEAGLWVVAAGAVLGVTGGLALANTPKRGAHAA
ncbi:hypothetical protein BWO91_17260 [Plantibacter flavus]|uniref:hypothetical protein n=1 Tax=Plantibacter flavus TaxID=150123 RepID=UPI00099C46E1|nr:hypothetical protein [Plantibacter flavus]AQX81475.1 hypothetical protein BWO91_17260 [Plantibacter flavus]